MIAAGVAARARWAGEEAVPSRMIVGPARGAHRRQPPEPRLPADQIGAVAPQGLGRRYELRGKAARVDQVEQLPHRVGADDPRGRDLAHEVRAIDGDDTARAPAIDDDLDRFPPERDLAAASADGARPRLHHSLHAARLGIVGHVRRPGRTLEELHEAPDRGLRRPRVEDHRRHEQQRAPHAGVVDVRLDPGAEAEGERGAHLARVRPREAGEHRSELPEAVGRTLETVARGSEEPCPAPRAAVEHDAVVEPVDTQRARNRPHRHLDPGLAGGLGAVVPRELAVADAVSVAVAEVDPEAVRRRHRPAAAADRVRGLEDHHPPPVPREDGARDEPRQVAPDDDDVRRGRPLHARAPRTALARRASSASPAGRAGARAQPAASPRRASRRTPARPRGTRPARGRPARP